MSNILKLKLNILYVPKGKGRGAQGSVCKARLDEWKIIWASAAWLVSNPATSYIVTCSSNSCLLLLFVLFFFMKLTIAYAKS